MTILQLLSIQEIASRVVYITPEQVGSLPYHIVVVGIVRDIAKILKFNIKRVMNILPMFRDYSVFIYENDSSDGTQQVLEEAQQEYGSDRFKYVCQSNIDPLLAIKYKGQGRFEKMARFRNEYVMELRKPEYNSVDYVMVIDWDHKGMFTDKHMSHIFSPNITIQSDSVSPDITIQSNSVSPNITIQSNSVSPNSSFILSKYDAMFANAQNRYPAARNIITSVVVWNQGYDFLAHVFLDGTVANFKRRIELYEDDEPYHVRSAFNGLAIYRKVVFDTTLYRGDKCEHICFHEDMWAQGYTNTYIMPHLVFCHDIF